MTLIDQLIQMKKSEKENDIIKMLDEFTLYERLSSVKALGTLEESKALQKRLPNMTKFIEGDFYQLSLAIIATNILTYLEYEPPQIIEDKLNNIKERTKRQLELAGGSSVRTHYKDLIEYNHNLEKDNVEAIYTIEQEDIIKIIIITKGINKHYNIYQGEYQETENTKTTIKEKPIVTDHINELENGKLIINNYSLAGNNHYPFAKYKTNKKTYYISMPSQNVIRLSNTKSLIQTNKDNKTHYINLTREEAGQMGLSRQNINEFSDVIASIIYRWEDEK